jgi:hypothetical protein
MQSARQILKWPLIIAAAFVVLRVVVERAGASDAVANILSVVALHFLIGPVYFAIRVAIGGEPRPYFTLFKLIALYAVLTRIMICPRIGSHASTGGHREGSAVLPVVHLLRAFL